MIFYLVLISNVNGQSCVQCCKTLAPRNETYYYTYYQDSGRLIGGEGPYYINTYGYSGNNTEGIMGRNNPKYECVSNIGPAPSVLYQLGTCSDIMEDTKIRPCSFPLDPVNYMNKIDMCGRFGIWLHGCQCCSQDTPQCDYLTPPCGVCSQGCVVINIHERVKLRTGDFIQVLPYDPELYTDGIRFK